MGVKEAPAKGHLSAAATKAVAIRGYADPRDGKTDRFSFVSSAHTSGHRPLTLHEVPAEVREAATMRGLGFSYRQIGEALRRSPQAVQDLLARHRRSLQSLRGAIEHSALSPRAVNVLGRHGIRTREQARQSNLLGVLARERNCGRKTLDEIARWTEEGAGSAGCEGATAGAVVVAA